MSAKLLQRRRTQKKFKKQVLPRNPLWSSPGEKHWPTDFFNPRM